jgi:GTP pyrophosphokinase
VNHKLVPLSYVLKSGDQVEVLTSKKQKPNSDWINLVKTARARGKIRTLFKKEHKAFTKKGERLLQTELEKISMELSPENLSKILDHFHEEKKEELYYKIGKGTYQIGDLDKTVFKEKSQSRWIKYWKLQFGKSSTDNANVQEQKKQPQKFNPKEVLKISDDNSVDYRIAECCNPIPGDEIIAFAEDDGRIIVHKRQCPVAMKLKSNFGERIISAVWETHKILSFPATIEIKGIDRVGVLGQIIKVISEVHAVNVNKVNLETKDGIFEGSITLYVHDVEDINNLSMNILKIKGINSVNRIN